MGYRIDFSRDFSSSVGGRFPSDGYYSGEEFREEILKPLLETNDQVVIDLDSLIQYSSSFLSEAFGGLVQYMSVEDIDRRVKFISLKKPFLCDRVKGYIQDAEKSTLRKSSLPLNTLLELYRTGFMWKNLVVGVPVCISVQSKVKAPIWIVRD